MDQFTLILFILSLCNICNSQAVDSIIWLFSTTTDTDTEEDHTAEEYVRNVQQCLNLGFNIFEARDDETCFITLIVIIVLVVLVIVCCCFICFQIMSDKSEATKRSKKRKKRKEAKKANMNNKRREREMATKNGTIQLPVQVAVDSNPPECPDVVYIMFHILAQCTVYGV